MVHPLDYAETDHYLPSLNTSGWLLSICAQLFSVLLFSRQTEKR